MILVNATRASDLSLGVGEKPLAKFFKDRLPKIISEATVGGYQVIPVSPNDIIIKVFKENEMDSLRGCAVVLTVLSQNITDLDEPRFVERINTGIKSGLGELKESLADAKVLVSIFSTRIVCCMK